MTRTEIVTFTFEIEIMDFAALQEFNRTWGSRTMIPPDEALMDERESVTRAIAHVAADAFTTLKPKTGLQLRSISVGQ